MSLLDLINDLGEWVLSNLDKVLFPAIAVVAGYIIYKAIARQITRLKEQNRLEEHLAYTLIRVVRWGAL